MKNRILNKRAQLTIFIIIALLIVAVLLIIFLPNLMQRFGPKTTEQIIAGDCLEKNVRLALNETLMHGGTIKPELYFRYNNFSIDYLCYTAEWYKTCVMQKPLLKQQIETEVKKAIATSVGKCVQDTIDNLKNGGYEVVVTGTKAPNLEINPNNKIKISIDLELKLIRGEEKIIPSSSFTREFSSNIYEMIMVASSIQNYEARYGDASIETYMTYYPELRVEKYRQDDGTKVYIVTDKASGQKLQFATRSLAWPPGYAIN